MNMNTRTPEGTPHGALKITLKNWLRDNRSGITAFAAIVLLYGVFALFGAGCPIKFLTGISCGGCGMSRAWLCALRLDFAGAMEYHPLFWLVIPAALIIIFEKKFPRFAKVSLSVIIALFLIVYFVRLADPSCDVVVFRPKEGLVYRLCSYILSLFGQSGNR